MHRPVAAPRVAVLAGAVERVDDPHPVVAVPAGVVGTLLGQQRVVGPRRHQLGGDEGVGGGVALVHQQPARRPAVDEVLAQLDEPVPGLRGESGGQCGVGLAAVTLRRCSGTPRWYCRPPCQNPEPERRRPRLPRVAAARRQGGVVLVPRRRRSATSPCRSGTSSCSTGSSVRCGWSRSSSSARPSWDRLRAPGAPTMSWAAHQFEVYAVQAHLPKKMRGKVSFWGIFLGDFTPDFLSKFWVYGITINGRHYGAEVPHKWHRGWPGMGVTHTLFLGIAARRCVLVVEAQPRVHGRLPARLRRPRPHRRQRLGRHDAAVPVLDAELERADVGVRGDRSRAASTSTRRPTTPASG